MTPYEEIRFKCLELALDFIGRGDPERALQFAERLFEFSQDTSAIDRARAAREATAPAASAEPTAATH